MIKIKMSVKNLILFFITIAIVIGGIFFDAHESLELSDHLGYVMNEEQTENSGPLTATSYYANYNVAQILAAAEIKDANNLSEVIKRGERSSSNKRIVILTLILALFLSIGTFFRSNLPSIFPWTNIICSRNNIMVYIHDQDGLK